MIKENYIIKLCIKTNQIKSYLTMFDYMFHNTLKGICQTRLTDKQQSASATGIVATV